MENTSVEIWELRDSTVFCHTACLCVLFACHTKKNLFHKSMKNLVFVIVKQCVYLRYGLN